MLASLWIGKTGLDSHSRVVDTVAQNISNANTVGYKKSRALFSDLFYQTIRQPAAEGSSENPLPIGLMIGSGSKIDSMQTIFSQAKAEVTDNKTDLMINGKGFFILENADGDRLYTRDGHFLKNDNGLLVSKDGHKLIPEIRLGQDEEVEFSDSGDYFIYQSNKSKSDSADGVLDLALFSNNSGLISLGSGLYQSSDASGDALIGAPNSEGFGYIKGGALETSNVNVSEELINMITAQRAFEVNTKVISAADSMLSNINQRIG